MHVMLFRKFDESLVMLYNKHRKGAAGKRSAPKF